MGGRGGVSWPKLLLTAGRRRQPAWILYEFARQFQPPEVVKPPKNFSRSPNQKVGGAVERMMKTPRDFQPAREKGRGAVPMIARTETPLRFHPRLVLAYADSAHAALSCRFFRRQGWEVHLANSGSEARRLADALAPDVVVLDTDLREESGWLTCAKLNGGNRGPKVVLVSQELDGENLAFADFVGASALVLRSAGPAALVDKVPGKPLVQTV
jgi:CheY-like chemotaxis protein